MSDIYRRKQSKHQSARRWKIAAAILCTILVLLVMVLIGFKQAPTIAYTKKDSGAETEEEICVLNGEQYVPKKNIETYLFMGIDNSGKVKKRVDFDEEYHADMLVLLVRDKSEGTYMTLPIDRNTMMDVKCLDLDGTYLATVENQISLAYADGDGLEMSCENVVDAVSNYLHGQTIDGYAAVNMGAIEIINHLIGGVTVTIEDDFSQVDPTMKIGETIHLTDQQAVYFVQHRWNVGDETNANRLRRQSVYMEQAEGKIRTLCSEDSKFPLTMYQSLEEYMVTNISDQKFSKMALLVAKEKSAGSLRIEGETIDGEEDFHEFYADEESLEAVIAQLFYRKYE